MARSPRSFYQQPLMKQGPGAVPQAFSASGGVSEASSWGIEGASTLCLAWAQSVFILEGPGSCLLSLLQG